jgi:cytochrome c
MQTRVVSVVPGLFLLAALGCGGGEKAADTTPAASAPPAADVNAPPGDQDAPPVGFGLGEQLAQGDKVWAESCTVCHGDSGEGKGKKNPAVVGGRALAQYKTGAELFTYLKEKMPKDDPGSLSEADYLAVTAWLIKKNGKLGDASAALTADSVGAIQLQ